MSFLVHSCYNFVPVLSPLVSFMYVVVLLVFVLLRCLCEVSICSVGVTMLSPSGRSYLYRAWPVPSSTLDGVDSGYTLIPRRPRLLHPKGCQDDSIGGLLPYRSGRSSCCQLRVSGGELG
eukprot:GHVQ01013355.1.p2 GENE.GHVQ01013355.1~~GHVQ01013355.1.p2  ORF type:complete len:120 (-),score=15.02 GHVQ01013355.1:980-1339(-)